MWRPKLSDRERRYIVAIGRRIRAARTALGLTQATVAERVSMMPSNYARIERGQTNPRLDTLIRIADGLRVDLRIELVPHSGTASKASTAKPASKLVPDRGASKRTIKKLRPSNK